MDEKEYPKLLKTREDYEFIMTNFPKEKWELDVNKLLFDAFDIRVVGVLEVSDKYTPDMNFSKRNYVLNYKKILKKLLRTVEDIDSDFEKVLQLDDNSELRKYKEFPKYYFHARIIENPNAKAIKLGFTIDELYALLFGLLDPSLKSTIAKFDELNKKYEEEIKNADKIIEEYNKENEEERTDDNRNDTRSSTGGETNS